MSRFIKGLITACLLMFFCAPCYAQEPQLLVDLPAMVSVNARFPLEYSIALEGGRFTAPDIEGLDVIAGPVEFQSYTSININGKQQDRAETKYSYVLSASKPGKYTIPAAKVTAAGKTYTSVAVTVEVVDNGSTVVSGQGQTQGAGQQNTVTKDDIFIRAIVDKPSVYKDQPVKVSFKIYYRVRVGGASGAKVPAFNGFWAQELRTDHYPEQQEKYGSSIYTTRIFAEYLLYPQQTGTLQIEPLELNAIVLLPDERGQSEYDALFGGFIEMEEVHKKISSSPVRISVKGLPTGAPESFNGAVGSFAMEVETPENQVAANSPLSYTVNISGAGNLSLLQNPEVVMPASFEQFNVESTQNITPSTRGISGYRQFKYPFIPRAEGEYTIEAVNFSYFDPVTEKYVTLSAPPVTLRVLPDSSGGASAAQGLISGPSKEELTLLGRDIRYIKRGNHGLVAKDDTFVCSATYYTIAGALAALFFALLAYLNKRIKQMGNADLIRGKRANKVALSRLNAANEYMNGGNRRRFYDEMLKALWGYMSDKLNIPVSNLTKENVREELLKRNIPAELANGYVGIISECEYAQYSPSEASDMQEIYNSALSAISKLESSIKRQV